MEPRLANRGRETVRVLSHELAHIVQARRGHVRPDTFDTISGRGRGAPADHAARRALDLEADSAAGRATRGEHAPIQAGSRVPQAQTWEWPNVEDVTRRLKDAAEQAALTVTLGPVAGPLVSRFTTSEQRAAAVKASGEAVNAAVNWVEDTGSAIDQALVEQVAEVPVVGHVARGAASVRKFRREVSVGAVKAVIGYGARSGRRRPESGRDG